jgi:hypothetical protein
LACGERLASRRWCARDRAETFPWDGPGRDDVALGDDRFDLHSELRELRDEERHPIFIRSRVAAQAAMLTG